MKKKLLLGTLSGLLLLALTACSAGNKTGPPKADMKQTGTMEGKGKTMKDEAKKTDGTQKKNETKKAGSTALLNKGKQAPDFEMTDLNGKTVKLSDFKGQKVYIKYWASWCPICLGGLEDINTLSGQDNGFKVITIVAPGQKGEKSMKDFKAWFSGVDNTKNITVLFDKDGAYTSKMGVRGYPTSEYIGSDGVMVKLVPGHADNDTIKTNFENIK